MKISVFLIWHSATLAGTTNPKGQVNRNLYRNAVIKKRDIQQIL